MNGEVKVVMAMSADAARKRFVEGILVPSLPQTSHLTESKCTNCLSQHTVQTLVCGLSFLNKPTSVYSLLLLLQGTFTT